MALSPLALSYISTVIGTPYGYLTTATIPNEQPAWAVNGAPPSGSYVKARSAYCAAVPNLMLRAAGWNVPYDINQAEPYRSQYDGGTSAYGKYYYNRGIKRTFNLAEAKTWHGMLVGRNYRSDSDPGHVAVTLLWSPSAQQWGYGYSDSVCYVVESVDGPAPYYAGINWNETLDNSHYYNGYEYMVNTDNFCPTK